jgi:hypothetical protein
MSYEHRVMVKMALGAKRARYISDWLTCREIGGDIAYWAMRIEQVNDAEEAVAALPPTGWTAVTA